MVRLTEAFAGSLPALAKGACTMSTQPTELPTLRRHKASNQGIVTLNHHDHYLGQWPADQRKPPEHVQRAFDTVMAEWLANGRRPLAPPKSKTITELVAEFWPFVQEHYRRHDGSATSEVAEFRYSLRPLVYLYDELPVNKFSPLKLKAVRQ